MATKLLIPTVAPRLPITRDEYDRRDFDEHNRVLALYFAQNDNVSQGLLGVGGGKYLSSVYGSFQNTATQTLAAANTPYVVVLNTTDFAYGVTLGSNRLTVAQDGVYNCQFSLQFENTTTGIIDTFVWLRKNGVDISGTASTWAVVSSHGGTNGYAIGACNFFVSLAAGDYIELVVAADATGCNIEAYASSTSPFTRPSVPSSVVTLAFVSAPLR